MTNSPALRRDLRLLDAIGIGLGAVVGAGIYVVMPLAAKASGHLVLIAFVIAALAAACNALSSAELAAKYPASGGTYEYGYQLLNPHAGFAAGWMFLTSKIAAAGTVALGLAGYLEPFVDAPPRLVATCAVVVFTIINAFGVRKSSAVNLAIVAVTLCSLILLIGYGVLSPATQPMTSERLDIRQLFATAALLFFAFTGYARIATLGGEVHEPQKTIPRAIIITLATSSLIYLAVTFVSLRALSPAQLGAAHAPLSSVARTISGEALATIVGIGAVFALLGVILSQLLGLSRMVFAMANRSDLPPALGVVDERGTPRVAVIMVGLLSALLASTGALALLASTAAFSILIYYFIANLASLRLQPQDRTFPRFVPVAGLLLCSALALSLPWFQAAPALAILALGLLGRALFSPDYS